MPQLESPPFEPLPEIPPPPNADLAPWQELAEAHGSPIIWAEGDESARLVVVLDNPGARRRAGELWICPTRERLRAAAAEAGIFELYVTWLVKFRPRRAYEKARVRAMGREEVSKEIDRVRPAVVLGLGDVAVSTLLRDEGAHVRDLRGQSLSLEGRPLVVGYHPLATSRRPNLYRSLVEDLKRAQSIVDATPET